MNDLPKDPVDPLLENAIGIHMIYKSYLRAGFNQEQALALCIGIIQETMRTATNETWTQSSNHIIHYSSCYCLPNMGIRTHM